MQFGSLRTSRASLKNWCDCISPKAPYVSFFVRPGGGRNTGDWNLGREIWKQNGSELDILYNDLRIFRSIDACVFVFLRLVSQLLKSTLSVHGELYAPTVFNLRYSLMDSMTHLNRNAFGSGKGPLWRAGVSQPPFLIALAGKYYDLGAEFNVRGLGRGDIAPEEVGTALEDSLGRERGFFTNRTVERLRRVPRHSMKNLIHRPISWHIEPHIAGGGKKGVSFGQCFSFHESQAGASLCSNVFRRRGLSLGALARQVDFHKKRRQCLGR